MIETKTNYQAEVEALISIIYTGSIDASVEEIRRMLLLAHSLYISVPVSEQLNNILGLNLNPHPPSAFDQFNQHMLSELICHLLFRKGRRGGGDRT